MSESRSQELSDPSLQLAPSEGDGPNFPALKKAFSDTVRESTTFLTQCRQNYETRFAIWPGQSSDNKKHSREGEKITPTPWEGASDLRVFMVDEVINAKVAMLSMARRKANIVCVPINGSELERAKIVSQFMRWLVNTQIPELEREDELLGNYISEKGVALTGQFWEMRQEKTLDILKIEDLQKAVPNIPMAQLIQQPHMKDTFESILEQFYDISKTKARAMVKELKTKGQTSIPVVGKHISRPVIRAFNLDEDVFIPPYVTDLEMAPHIFRVQYYTAETLRSFVNTDNWDAGWVEAAIKKCKGKLITMVPDRSMEPTMRNYIFRYQKYSDLIGVVYAYQRLSDEDGIPGIYLTIFNPDLPEDDLHPGYAKHGLLGYRHGEYPFTLHRREFLSRRIHDSRGIPEAGKAIQDQVKAHLDSRIDAASIGILPPICHPPGRPPGNWGPGSRIAERRPGEYHHADRPGGDPNTERSEEILRNDFKSYFAIHTPETDNQVIDIINQFEVDKFLVGWEKAYRQVWKLYQQYGDDKIFFRVIGLQKATPQLFEKGDPSEDFDFYLTFNTIQFDNEALNEQTQSIIQVCMAADKFGQVDWSKVLQVCLSNIDPALAEELIQPRETATQQTVAEVQGDLSQLFGGVEKDIKLGTPPDLALQVIQGWAKQKDVNERYNTDEAFKGRVDKYVKQLQFQKTQSQNAKIGKFGA